MNKLIDLKQQFMYLNTNKTIETIIGQLRLRKNPSFPVSMRPFKIPCQVTKGNTL